MRNLANRVVSQLRPPFSLKAYRFFKILLIKKNILKSPDLDGGSHLFQKLAIECNVYGEYGSGASTKWVLNNTDATIISVETDHSWVDNIIQSNRQDRINICYVNLGYIGELGKPKNMQFRREFYKYACCLWNYDKLPDFVLIDGRFRVLCFFVSLLNSKEGTKILLDDYVNRPCYHVAEEFLHPKMLYGGQALFEVPSRDFIDVEGIEKEIERFQYVTD